jgi:hypothetical protein
MDKNQKGLLTFRKEICQNSIKGLPYKSSHEKKVNE